VNLFEKGVLESIYIPALAIRQSFAANKIGELAKVNKFSIFVLSKIKISFKKFTLG